MSTQFYKTGIIHVNDLYEADATNEISIIGDGSYIPSTGTNSCINTAKWLYTEDTSVGDVFRVYLTVFWSGFDESNTSGTFNIRFRGSNYTTPTSSQWTGSNPIVKALNEKQSLKTLVLSATSGVYVYETTFSILQAYFDDYVGSNIGVRSDYSNGTGMISLSDIKIIPDKYSVSDASSIMMRIGDDYIATNDFIEY